MAVATGFYPDPRTHGQAAVEPLCLPITVYQLVLGDLSGLRLENRYLLKAGMKITPYNLHRRLLLVPDQYQSSTSTFRIIAEAFAPYKIKVRPSVPGMMMTGFQCFPIRA